MSDKPFEVVPGDMSGVTETTAVPTRFDPEPRFARKGLDGIWRMDKHPSERLTVRLTVEINGQLRRADLERFAQALGATASLEFEDGGGGPGPGGGGSGRAKIYSSGRLCPCDHPASGGKRGMTHQLRVHPFSLKDTLECGQFLRFTKVGDTYLVQASDQIFSLWQKGDLLYYRGTEESFLRQFFRLDDDFNSILKEINRDPIPTSDSTISWPEIDPAGPLGMPSLFPQIFGEVHPSNQVDDRGSLQILREENRVGKPCWLCLPETELHGVASSTSAD